ncbi:hypothetical protein [Fluviicola sp.]|uniref:hypothetical protein n=1 Tax=Fluviicola sp. TaxID=1917219 RepID=UPI0031D4C96B
MNKLLLLLFLLPGISFAAFRPHSDDYMLNYLRWGARYEFGNAFQQNIYYGAKPEILKQHHVSTVKAYRVNQKGKQKEWYERRYDTSGRLIQMKTTGDVVDYTFADTLLREVNRTTKKHAYKTKISYDSQSRITKTQSFEDGKLTSETNYGYFNGQQTSLVEKKLYGKKEKTYRLETDYDQLSKKTVESRYVINGELKKRWTYSCDEKGKIQETKVEEITQCQYFDSNNDGSYSSYMRTIEDGKDYLQETSFSKDSVLTEYKRFLHDTILVNHNTYSKEKDVFEGYSKKGKRSYKLIEEKDVNGNIVKRVDYYKKTDKSPITTLSVYSEKNLIREVTYQDKSKTKFEYTYW